LDPCSRSKSMKELPVPYWGRLNLTEDYTWHPNRRVSQGRFRPLRPVGMPITVDGASL
jgi:hypothetical protein